jgi:hypothetical protein
MSGNQGDEAVKMLARISRQLREALAATLTCAHEQYVAISIPGAIIDRSKTPL